MNSTDCPPPIFILGTTRSGTTLLSLMLGQNSEIFYAGEFQWVFDFAGSEEPHNIDEYHSWLHKSRFFQIHRPSLDHSLDFPDLARSILRQMKDTASSSKPLLTASVHRHFRQCLKLWPRAKFIHLVRDGRDVAASWMKFGWHGNTWSAAHEWVALLDEWHAVRNDLKDDQFLELRLEDLIDRPDEVVAVICEFLGVQYQPQMLDYHKNSTYAPVTKSRSQQWRRKLSVNEIRVFEAIAGSKLDKYGYSRSGEAELLVPNYMRLPYRVQNKLRCTRHRIREFGLRLWFFELIARRIGLERAHSKFLNEMHEITNSKLE